MNSMLKPINEEQVTVKSVTYEYRYKASEERQNSGNITMNCDQLDILNTQDKVKIQLIGLDDNIKTERFFTQPELMNRIVITPRDGYNGKYVVIRLG